MIEKNNPKITTAWAFYDWANSAYALVITAAIFPIYWGNITGSLGKNTFLFFGLEPNAVFDFSLMLSFSIVLILSPILSSVADRTGSKLNFLKGFCYLGGLSCMGLWFFTNLSTAWVGLLFSMLASVGFWGSLVFYNAYLPEIATFDKQNTLSAKGFIFGYIGSITLLILCLVLIMIVANEHQKGLFTRISFVLTGIWWIGFAQYSFSLLPKKNDKQKLKSEKLVKSSFHSFIKTAKELISDSIVKKYLVSFFFFSLGMQTIFLMATLFGQSELRLDTSKLILTILVIQFIALFGAWLFSFLANKIGNFLALNLGVFVWIVICVLGYLIDKQDKNVELEFYFIAILVGLVMGGIQSLARSTYSKLLPNEPNKYTIYFSFYDMLEKCALVIGLAVYGLLIQYTGGMKSSTLAMGFSFFISWAILLNLHFSVKRHINP